MKYLIKIIFLLAFIMPFSTVSAASHDESTMDVIEHSSADHFENEIELPEKNDDKNDINHHDANDDHDEKEDEHDDQADDQHDDQADDKNDSQEDSHNEKEDDSKK